MEDMGGILRKRLSTKGKKVMVLKREGLVMELDNFKPKKLFMVVLAMLGGTAKNNQS